MQLGGLIMLSCLTPHSQHAACPATGLCRARVQDKVENQGMASAAAGLQSLIVQALSLELGFGVS